MKATKQRRMIDKTNCDESGGMFENLRIKVNQNTYFSECYFINCTFVGRGKLRANFRNCAHI